jgi:hypothetical protein
MTLRKTVGGVPARLGPDLGEVGKRGAVLAHVSQASAAEVTEGERQFDIDHRVTGRVEVDERTHPVVENAGDGARVHLFETDGKTAFDGAALDRLAREEQRRRSGGTVVVDVDHWNAGHPGLVDCALARAARAKDITRVRLLHEIEGDVRIRQGQANGLAPHIVIGGALAGLGEGDHADARHQHVTSCCFDHLRAP